MLKMEENKSKKSKKNKNIIMGKEKNLLEEVVIGVQKLFSIVDRC